jgi:hypothetical protein
MYGEDLGTGVEPYAIPAHDGASAKDERRQRCERGQNQT